MEPKKQSATQYRRSSGKKRPKKESEPKTRVTVDLTAVEYEALKEYTRWSGESSMSEFMRKQIRTFGAIRTVGLQMGFVRVVATEGPVDFTANFGIFPK
jgi:hypothetical protein